MTAFFSSNVLVGTTPVLLVPPSDFDRNVVIRTVGSDTYIGFTSADTHFRLPSGGSNSGVTICLPADESLWSASSLGTVAVYVIAGGK